MIRKHLTLAAFIVAVVAATCVAQSTIGVFTGLRLNGNTISQSAGTVTVTLPAATDTLVGKATTDTLTNKTMNAESTGNVLTVPAVEWWHFSTCSGGGPYEDSADAGSATLVYTCNNGSNTNYSQADFVDGSTNFIERVWGVPADWTGAVDLVLFWKTSATSGNVVWQIATTCDAVGDSLDQAYNTASTVTDAAQGTTNRLNTASVTGITTTGCAAGELMHVKILRDPADASDTIGATASIVGAQWTYRRAM